MHSVDLTQVYYLLNEFLNYLLTGIALVVAAWLRWAFHKYLTPWLGQQAETKAANDLNLALENGVKIALNSTQAWESAHRDIQVQGTVAAMAARYAASHAPDAVNRFGLSPDQLATKALAYVPAPPATTIDTTGAVVVTPKIEVNQLPQLEGVTS